MQKPTVYLGQNALQPEVYLNFITKPSASSSVCHACRATYDMLRLQRYSPQPLRVQWHLHPKRATDRRGGKGPAWQSRLAIYTARSRMLGLRDLVEDSLMLRKPQRCALRIPTSWGLSFFVKYNVGSALAGSCHQLVLWAD